MFVPVTLVLEMAWVMRGFYRLSPADFVRAMRHLLGLSNVTVEDWERVGRALELHLEGLDFSDALHWSLSAHSASDRTKPTINRHCRSLAWNGFSYPSAQGTKEKSNLES